MSASSPPSAAASAPAAAVAGAIDQEAVVAKYRELRAQEQSLFTRIAEMETQEHEYRNVGNTIEGLEPARRCYQLINGVLVERTIADVLPVVKQNHDGIISVLKSMSEQLEKVTKERQEHQTKYGIRTVSQAEAQRMLAEQQASSAGAASGADGAARVSSGVLA